MEAAGDKSRKDQIHRRFSYFVLCRGVRFAFTYIPDALRGVRRILSNWIHSVGAMAMGITVVSCAAFFPESWIVFLDAAFAGCDCRIIPI